MRPARLAGPGAVHRHPALVPPWPGRHVELDGRRAYLREAAPVAAGTEPALYLHGLGGSAHNWTDLAGLLAHRLHGYAVDLPGFGRSDPAARYSLAAYGRWVARFVEQDGRGPVHLVGNSLGGVICVLVAAARPDLVRTVTLISPAMPFLNPARSAQGRLVPLLALPRAGRLARRRLALVPPEELARQVLEACFGRPERLHPVRMAESVAETRLRYDTPWHMDAYLGVMRSLVAGYLRAYLPGDGSLWRLAARVGAPTLVVGGRLDRLVDPAVPARVAQAIPDARLLLLDDVGHVAQMEVPEVTARAIVALLDEGSRRPERRAGANRGLP